MMKQKSIVLSERNLTLKDSYHAFSHFYDFEDKGDKTEMGVNRFWREWKNGMKGDKRGLIEKMDMTISSYK